MENWRYASLSGNETISNQKVSDQPHYAIKSANALYAALQNFIVFRHDSLSLGTEAEIQVNNWAIDIYVSQADLPVAWDSIFPILVKYDCELFQIVNLKKNPAEKYQITIFVIPGQEYKYRLALSEIEYVLKHQNIHSGIPTKTDKMIGVYSAVRFMPAKETIAGLANSYNPDNIPEVFYPLNQSDFFQEARLIISSSEIKNKRKFIRKFILGKIAAVSNILVLQDIYHLVKLPEFDYLRKKKKFRFMPFGKDETLALRAINKAIRKRLLALARNIKVISVAADHAIRDVFVDRKIMKSVAPRSLRKYLRLQKKGIIKVMGAHEIRPYH